MNRMNLVIPEGKMNTTVWVLTALSRKLLFPNLTVGYWESIVCDVEKLLEMHVRRLSEKDMADQTMEAMRITARGIYLAHREIKKHPEKYHNGMPKYMPKQYFRINNLVLKAGSKLKNGQILEENLVVVPQFKNVMDTWIPNERDRLNKLAAQNSQFMAWQTASFREEIFFERIVTELAKKKTKVSEALAFVHQSKQGLLDIFAETNLKESTQREVMYSFQSKVTAITESLKEGADALQYQKWEAFANAFKNAV